MANRSSIFEFLLIGFAILFFLFPFFWIALSSFKATGDIVNPRILFEFVPTTINYENLFSPRVYNFGKSLIDSFFIASIVSVIVILIGLLSGYAFTRYQFFGRDNLLMLTLGTRMMPAISIAIPIFFVLRSWELVDTYIALIWMYILFNVPLGVWLLTGYMQDLPKELDESAQLDGYSSFQILFKVILPLLWPGLITVFLFSFINCWSEFLMAQILTGTNVRTVPRVASQFVMRGGRENDWGCMTAAAAISTIPSFIMIFVLQKRIIRGLTLGAVR